MTANGSQAQARVTKVTITMVFQDPDGEQIGQAVSHTFDAPEGATRVFPTLTLITDEDVDGTPHTADPDGP